MNHSDNSTIDTLRRLICEAAGCGARSPADLYTLKLFIESRTRETVGLTTVKRFWQYGGLSSQPRQSTLNVMARAIGYRSYDDFCEHYGDCSPSSDIVLGKGVKATELKSGERLMLRWNPGREVVVEYLGNSTFRVLSSEGSKLHADDTFQAAFFALGHAAMLANVIHGNSCWPLYEIGQQGGLTLVSRLSSIGE